MTAWDDLNARARGLAGHLLDAAVLRAVLVAPDTGAFGRALEPTAYAPFLPSGAADPEAVDRALGALHGARLALLSRWAGPRREKLRAVFETEERASLVALLRGAAAGAPADRRLLGLTPTPDLPAPALDALAREPSPAGVVARLAALEHPWAGALAGVAGSTPGDLALAEARLRRVWLERARDGARGGGRELRRFVADTLDLENAMALRAEVMAHGRDAHVEAVCVPGGRRLRGRAPGRVAAAGAAGVDGALDALFQGSPLAGVFAPGPGPGAGPLEERAVRSRARALRLRARVAPTGPAPLLAFLLRARAELLLLRRVLWTGVLGRRPSLEEALP